tara:strand:- start:47 stop:301 length:255 start_codon:yes stop_codon:yes gene_type:complete
MEYVIYTESIDDYGKGRTHKYKVLKNAKKKWSDMFGNDFERGSGYYTANDGVVIATISIVPHDAVKLREAEKKITGCDPYADFG